MKGRVIRQKFITRADIRAHRERIYVFGDNMRRAGYGGQAAAMRGEPNTKGIPTKRAPGTGPDDFFADADLHDPAVWHAISGAFDELEGVILAGCDVVIPADGIGTGLARLQTRAPKIARYIELRIADLEDPRA